jgi:tRNA A-37 threonylcarbamoyl transferase component Bud32
MSQVGRATALTIKIDKRAMASSHGEQPRSSVPSAGVDAICDAFEAAWLAGQEPRIEDFLPRVESVHEDALFRELLLSEWDLRSRHAQDVELQTYLERFAESRPLVAELWHGWHAKQSECSGDDMATALPTTPPEGFTTIIKLLEKVGDDGFGSIWAGRKRAGEEGLSQGSFESLSFANGRYQVQSLLGEGGQKRVFLARDSQLDRDVVIGVLNRRQIESDSLNRLRHEAKALARLDEHPNVVRVYDIGEEDGNPFIVTQYVRGGSVADVLFACRPAQIKLPEAIRIAAQTCRALSHAHAHGILHRDVKPRNVWLMRDGTVKLGDFGLALSLDRTELTDEDMRAGTAAYIAPEQALGSAVSPQSDLFSLGVMLYEMVAGRRPFSGDTALAVISQHVNSRPVAPSWQNPAINEALDRLILELLAKSPADRPTSAAVVAQPGHQ